MILLTPKASLKANKSKILKRSDEFKKQVERVALMLAEKNNFNIKNVSVVINYNNDKTKRYVLVDIHFR